MKLTKFIEQTGITLTRLAERTGLSFHQVYHIKNGGIPTLKTAVAIEHYTDGMVRAKDLLSDEVLQKIYDDSYKAN